MFAALLVSLAMLIGAPVIGEKLGIIDHPDAVRKRHTMATPLVGGLAIMVPFLLWTAASYVWNGGMGHPQFLLALALCGAGATLVGYADDQSGTSPSSRFLSLILLSVIALVIDPTLVPQQLNWGSFSPLHFSTAGAFVFVAIAMTGFVNAVNMADGQNGLVSGMFVIWAGCLMLATHGADMAASQILFETALIVLLFNLSGRVFLGDSGTYGITLVFGLLAIIAHNRWGVTAETITVWFFIPIADCLRLIISRALRGLAPTAPDRDHFHHRLEDKLGKTPGLCVYLGVVAASSLIASIMPQLALVCMIVLAAFYFSFAWLTETKVEAETAGSDLDDGAITGNVVKLESKEVASGRG
ncbi:MAG TPA: MraY family glycosyltransferase [Rhizomicrobium sp.]